MSSLSELGSSTFQGKVDLLSSLRELGKEGKNTTATEKVVFESIKDVRSTAPRTSRASNNPTLR